MPIKHIYAPHLSFPPPRPNTPPLPPPESPPILTKIQRLKRELLDWRAQGLADKTTRAKRLEACKGCAYYAASGNLYFGECRAPGCGCTRAKLWLSTSKCPHPQGARW